MLFTNNDSVRDVAMDMQAAGIEVAAIVDTRQAAGMDRPPELDGIRVLAGHEITDVLGRRRVRRVIATPRSGGAGVAMDCDLLGVSGGWDPSVGLWSQAGGDIAYSDGICAFVPEGACRQVVIAGAAAGAISASAARDDGLRAGNAAARKLGIGSGGESSGRALGCGYSIEPFWQGSAAGRSDVSFVDILNDVTVADIHLALREGFRSVEQVKRYTTAGMGFNQGKTVGPNVAGIVLRHRERARREGWPDHSQVADSAGFIRLDRGWATWTVRSSVPAHPRHAVEHRTGRGDVRGGRPVGAVRAISPSPATPCRRP